MSHQITFERAENDLFDAAVYLGATITDANGHSAVMQTVVPLYLAKDDVDSAAAFADTIEDSFVRDRLLTLVAEKCAALDDDEYALQLSDALEDSAAREAAGERIALQKAEKNQFEKALSIAETLAHPDYVFAAVAARMYLTDETKAKNLIENITDEHAAINAWLGISAVAQERGDTERAVANLERAIQSADAISSDDEEKIRELIQIGNVFVELEQKDRAVLIFDRAQKLIEKFDLARLDNWLTTIAAGFLAAGSIELADRALDLIKDNVQMAQALFEFSKYYQEQDLPADALDANEEAYQILRSQKDSQVRDSRARFTVYGNVAVQFAALEKPERALEAAQENYLEEMRAWAFKEIANLCVNGGKFESARQALNAIADDANRVFALIGASDEAAKNDFAEESNAFLAEAFELAETVPQLPLRSTALTAIAARFVQSGSTEKAREVSLENLEIISEIRDETGQANALATLSELYTAKKFTLNEAESRIVKEMLMRASV